jgi:hypothetical protein
MAEPTTTELMTAIADLQGFMLHGFLDLHGAMLHGFERVEERLDRMEVRLTTVETRLTAVETHLTSVEGEVRGIHHWMARSDARFEALETRF